MHLFGHDSVAQIYFLPSENLWSTQDNRHETSTCECEFMLLNNQKRLLGKTWEALGVQAERDSKSLNEEYR